MPPTYRYISIEFIRHITNSRVRRFLRHFKISAIAVRDEKYNKPIENLLIYLKLVGRKGDLQDI